MNDIVNLLELIATGINPTTGEIFETENLRGDPAIKDAIFHLIKVYMNDDIMPVYLQFEKRFPGYVIIQKRGCFYTAYNDSAEILSAVLGYRLYIDAYGRRVVSGSDMRKMAIILAKSCVKFVVFNGKKIICQVDKAHPFSKTSLAGINQLNQNHQRKLLMLDASQLQRFEYSLKTPIPISEITKRLIALKTEAQEGTITYKDIVRWLNVKGLLEEGESEADNLKRRPTSLGLARGISCEKRINSRGAYQVVVYNAKGQKFIVDHYHDIIRQYDP